MAWNQPGNNGQDNDPWGNNKRKKTSNSPDNILEKLNNLFKKQPSNNNGGSNSVKAPFNLSALLGGILLLIIGIWFISGFYTVNQSQRGVITRFGQVQSEIVQPGLNWKPSLVDSVHLVDTQGTQSLNVHGFMITAGENLIFVEMNVQYRITNPIKYLFNVKSVEDSLRQAADSALRTEVSSSNMDAILTDGRAELETRTKQQLVDTISNYDMGITIVDLNFQSARPPEEVQESYNDANRAREDRDREINKAEADKVQIIQEAEGRAAKILADADSYRVRVELEAQGDVARFEKLLPEYRNAPEITKARLYIETMERILANTNKVMVNDKSGNLLVLPLEQMLNSKNTNSNNDMKIEQSNLNTPNNSSINNVTPPVVTPTVTQTNAIPPSDNTNMLRGSNINAIRTGR
ncbi:membrane protease subunit HflK [Frischella perrara]|uniref:Protein HflK n=1 Tax=Frischella perrara TaxID=1267021 RepID=A0A0A7RY00_FRIPE|nr:FtsH protease activity modulator HflK [Frischella perrara]AJA44133.1 HflK protein [Frischella perrara]PWV59203.1 membrane protease subunit HflK [Frischella perrara]